LQRPLARLIARARAPKVRGYYQEIGGGSPLLRITNHQAELLQRSLQRHGDFRVEVAMRYSSPRSDQAVQRMLEQGIRRLVALPLYPHYSSATTGSSVGDLERSLARRGPPATQWELVRVNDFHDDPHYLEALAGTVQQGIDALGGEARVLFSAHSLPKRLIDRGEPYLEQVRSTVAEVVQRLGLKRWDLGFQSRSGPVRWLEPNVLDLVNRAAGEGTETLLVVPVSFVSDHIETLHEIDVKMRQFALDRGIRTFARAPALNDNPAFIEALTRIVLSACEIDLTS
jgi:ferrochelatase